MSIGPYGSGAFGTVPFSSTPFFSAKGIIDAVLRDTGHSNPATETVKRQAVLGFMNNRYARIVTGRDWSWLNQELDTTFEGPYQSGTVQLTQGSSDVIGTGTLFSANVIPNQKLIVSNYVNLIESVDSNTHITLQGEWSGDTGANYTFRIVRSIYEMPSDAENIKSISLDRIGEMVPVGPQELTRKKQYRPDYIGIPMWYTEIARREDGVRLIEVYPHPDKKYNVHFNYRIKVVPLQDSDDSFPLMPDAYRNSLYYGALSEMYRYLRDNANAQLAEADYQRSLLNMQNDQQLTDSRYIIQPGRDYRSRRRRRRFRVAMDRTDFSRDG